MHAHTLLPADTSLGFQRILHPVALAAALLLALAFHTVRAAEKPRTDQAHASTTLTPEGGRIIIEAHGLPKPAPVFFSANVDHVVRVSQAEVAGELRLKLHVVQGRPEVLSLGLSGDGDVVEVTGAHLRDWSVRQAANGRRFLDLRLLHAEPTEDLQGRSKTALPQTPATLQDFEVLVRTLTRKPSVPGSTAILIATPGDAVGFAAKVTLQPDASVDLRVLAAPGMTPLGENAGFLDAPQFFSSGEARLEVQLSLRGAAPLEAELVDARLVGRVNEASGSVEFRLSGQVRAQKGGARLRLLTGRAALNDKAAGDGWRVELVAVGDKRVAYELVCDREGVLPVEVSFIAAVREDGDWRAVDFAMPAGAVVPLRLEGLGAEVSFKQDARVVPATTAQGWRGFLPADGAVSLAWKRTREAGEGALFFTSTEQTEVRVGAGLLRQTSQIALRILQGKLSIVRCRVEGPGEILGVEGANIVGWKVLPAENARVLEVRFSRPVESAGSLTIQLQADLGNWPVRAEPVRLTPEGGVRHSGFLRIANRGAVRLEVADPSGMMQLAPAQWPGAAIEADARQVFVYRFPAANYTYRLLATQIQPEIAISAIATYELLETARVINASLELDVREAPLRDWSLRIPEDYTVVAVTGSDVSDYVAESEAADGYRTLRVLFGRPIEGRQLLQLRLEKNQAAAAGEWRLPALQFPGAKSVRGHIGAVATPGYRIAPARVERLVEVPLSFFPRQAAGLQQAWRLREPDWSAEVGIEALGQSVQADVFHLYSLKEGVVSTSVLLNYFVVGAPANEWRIEVPQTVGNIDVVGQNVRRDWRREGDQIIVSLHQPVLGAATLLVTFEQPMSARGGVIQPGQVRPIGVQSERGFVQVVSPLQVKHEIRRIDGGLLKLEPAELPAEFRTFTSSPSLAVYHYTARPFALEMSVEWYVPGETVEQVVDFAKLSSQVSRDGQVVTEAKFFVKTRGRKALRLVLPKDMKLWEARVDNELVNARADGEQTIVPLPARVNPNDPVVVALRLGQASGGSGSSVTLGAPRAASAPTVINEWIVRSDSGRLLVPRGGNAELVRPALTETGFEWISTRGVVSTLVLCALVGLGLLLLRSGAGWRTPVGMLVLIGAVACALMLTVDALMQRRVNLRELTFAATMVPANEAVTIEVANVASWRAMIVGWGVAAALAGVGALVVGAAGRASPPDEPLSATARRGRLALLPVGVMLLAAGMLAQRGGAMLFFGAASVTIVAFLMVPVVLRWRSEERGAAEAPPPTEPGPAASPVVSLIAIAGLTAFTLFGGNDLHAQSRPSGAGFQPVNSAAGSRSHAASALLFDGTKAAQAIVQTWSIRGDRVFAELEFTVRGAPGDSFLLLRAPAVLTDFKGEGLRVGKIDRDGQAAYYVAPEREGVLTARARFELALPDRTRAIPLPTGAAATQRVTIELDQGGWEFVSPAAVQVIPTPELGDNRSGATLVLAPQGVPTIRLQPRSRNVATEETTFFAEAATLYVPGPGVVNGFARITVRPVQGRVSSLEIDVPPGLTVGEVNRGPVGAWRFDPEKRRLHVAVEPAQTGVFKFDVETQLGAGELPFPLTIQPLRVRGAAGDVGMIALAFGGDAQSEGVRTSEVSAVNVQDFESELIPRSREGHPLATVQNVWRYGQAGGRVELKVAPVAPEVRVTSRQVLSLDDDRMVMAVDLRVAITRVGLFKLGVALPEGLEVEAVSGAALNHWTETQEGSQRFVTLHLNGRTLGEQAFSLTLVGAAPGAQEAWAFPRLVVREATRQTGEIIAVPGKGIRLRAADRDRVTQLDPRAVGAMQPGTLAFRLLHEEWVLRLGIEMLDPWVTVQALHEVTLREGQTLTRINARYRVENAAVKSLRVRLPGLSDESIRTVRAMGTAVSDMVRVADTADVWEIRFQRGIAGETEVQIEFQSPAARERGRESITPPEFVGARQAAQFVAIRSGGRLELDAGNLPRGWTRIDWSAVPAAVQPRSDRSMPAFCFRVAEPEAPLAVTVRRHEVAEALKLRVTRGDLTTLFAPDGAFLTAVELGVEVIAKSTLRVRLPEGARLFNTFVNGESVSVVREGAAYLFHVAPTTAGDRAATVRLVYAAKAAAGRSVELVGPSLSVPLENVAWRVVIPPGYELDDYSGALRLREERLMGSFGLEQYEAVVSSKRTSEARQAVTLLQQANSWLQAGEQQKASEALSRVSNIRALDEASNEDARVQLRSLKTQQAVLGLNTRRQRLYLDNRADAARNEQLERAATLNPFMQGKDNFNPQEVDQLLMGNTVEENTALRGIATKMVDQQLSTEPAPGAIDVTLPERGQVFTFTRSLQVDGSAPLELKLDIDKVVRSNPAINVLLLLAIAALAGGALRGRAAESQG